jgi:hypothetical protein
MVKPTNRLIFINELLLLSNKEYFLAQNIYEFLYIPDVFWACFPFKKVSRLLLTKTQHQAAS